MGTVENVPSKGRSWISPTMKQCFVTSGVSLNLTGLGLVVGFGAGLLGQLNQPESDMHVDISSVTWLASLPAIFMFVGNFLVIPIMDKFGRRTANLLSICLLTVTWICIFFAPSIDFLFVARALQGIYMGMSTTLGSLLIGEYTSPKNRGAFLMTVSLSISTGVFAVHTFSSFTDYRKCAMICAGIAVIDMFIIALSPESPTWLAFQGRYDDCKKVFRWLRGDTEEEELRKMIEASMFIRESKVKVDESSFLDRITKSLTYFKDMIQKKEFYKPMIIMCHIYAVAHFGGVNILVVYIEDFIHALSGIEDIRLFTITLDAQRIISNIIAIYVVKKIKRRTMLFTTVGIDVAVLLAIAAYTYAKTHYTLPFDHPMIGVVLTHLLMFAIAMGTLSLCFILAGELFPLESKALAGGLSVLAFSACLFIALKTTPFWFATLGVHGTCAVIALFLCYCMVVAWFLLPETKDKTLQDIEEEFRGKSLSQDAKVSKDNTDV